MNAEAQPRFIRSFGRRDVGGEIAITFFKAQRIQHFVAANFETKFPARFDEHVPNHCGFVVGDVKFPAQFARVTDSLSVGIRPVDVDQFRGQVGMRGI